MRLTLLALITLVCAPLFAQQGAVGTWLTQKQNSHIAIYEENGTFWGKITWVRDSLGKPGDQLTDDKNPDESLRSRRVLGLVILRHFEYDGDDRWSGGEIYDPETGNTYSCKMKLADGNLEIRGYVMLALFGRTEVWTRVR
jgi:uncharacterized protein (DUF2147 family)